MPETYRIYLDQMLRLEVARALTAVCIHLFNLRIALSYFQKTAQSGYSRPLWIRLTANLEYRRTNRLRPEEICCI